MSTQQLPSTLIEKILPDGTTVKVPTPPPNSTKLNSPRNGSTVGSSSSNSSNSHSSFALQFGLLGKESISFKRKRDETDIDTDSDSSDYHQTYASKNFTADGIPISNTHEFTEPPPKTTIVPTNYPYLSSVLTGRISKRDKHLYHYNVPHIKWFNPTSKQLEVYPVLLPRPSNSSIFKPKNSSSSSNPSQHSNSNDNSSKSIPTPDESKISSSSEAIENSSSQNSNSNQFPNKYLKPSEYPFQPNEYPAPLPVAKLPDYLSNEKFFEIKSFIQSKAESFQQINQKFNKMIRDKIFLNVFHHPSIHTITLKPIPHGLTKSRIINSELQTIEKFIRCYLCEQIAITPKECRSCLKWYCFPCIIWLRDLISSLSLTPFYFDDQFLCILPHCVKFYSSKDDYPFYQEISSKNILETYNKSKFLCRRALCSQSFSPDSFIDHEKKCRLGLFIEDIDLEFQTPFKSSTIREELIKFPKKLSNFLPNHIKTNNYEFPPEHNTHVNNWHERFQLLASLANLKENNPSDPLLNPIAIRVIAKEDFGYWTNYHRSKDPTAPLSESEEFLQNVVGLAPTVGSKPDPSVVTRPRTVFWSRVPFYLINDSEEWLNVARGKITNSNPMQKKPIPSDFDNEENSSFIRIDPLKRLNAQKQQEVIDNIKKWFPSLRELRQFTNQTKTSPTTSLDRIAIRNHRKSVAAQEFKRLTTIKMPDLNPITQELINDARKMHPSPDTVYSIHMAYCRISSSNINNSEITYRPRPVWVVIVDGNNEIVYESLVQYPRIDYLDTRFHGLIYRDLRFAKNFHSVRDQILTFFASATVIIGSGLINMLRSLDLSYQEINNLKPKLREITQFFSPYSEHPASLSLISFILFPGYIIEKGPHSPAIEALTSMNLYIGFWFEIEELAAKENGIHHSNMVKTCGNNHVARLLKIYEKRVKRGIAIWPSNWSYYLHHNEEPKFTQQCVTPDSGASSPEWMYSPDYPIRAVNASNDCNSNSKSETENCKQIPLIDLESQEQQQDNNAILVPSSVQSKSSNPFPPPLIDLDGQSTCYEALSQLASSSSTNSNTDPTKSVLNSKHNSSQKLNSPYRIISPLNRMRINRLRIQQPYTKPLPNRSQESFQDSPRSPSPFTPPN